jgi:hypothetical protein
MSSGTVELGNEISRTNRIFIEVRRIGEVDDKGKVRFARGFKGKFVAKPDFPLMHFAALIDALIIPSVGYSSEEACRRDIETFKKWANSLGAEAPNALDAILGEKK